jgi:hypothetical protein
MCGASVEANTGSLSVMNIRELHGNGSRTINRHPSVQPQLAIAC